MDGRGFGLDDVRQSIEIVSQIRWVLLNQTKEKNIH